MSDVIVAPSTRDLDDVSKDLADWMVFDELASSGSRVTAAD